MNKLLSLVMVGRHDNYHGGFAWRMETSINGIARNWFWVGNRLEQDLEIIVVDWGSEGSKLHEDLKLSEHARRMTRFIIVPPTLAKEKQKDSPFPAPIAINTGIRRATGKFVAQRESDCIETPEFTEKLYAFLQDSEKSQGLWFATRKHMPYPLASACPNAEVLAWLMEHAYDVFPDDYDFKVPYVGQMWPTSMMLMRREFWNHCRGFDERMIYWGWLDPDLAIRFVKQGGASAFHWFKDHGFPEMVHLEHYAPGKQRPGVIGSEVKANEQKIDNEFTVNDENWGMAEYAFAEHHVGKIVGESVIAPGGGCY